MSISYYRRKRQHEQMLEMQAMSNPSKLFFRGDSNMFQMKLNQMLSRPSQPITDAYIVVIGIKAKQLSMGLLLLTIMLGICFMFPLFFMCCDWWKGSVYQAYQIPLSLYQKLQIILQNPQINSVYLQICDNGFGKEKSQVLFKQLQSSNIKKFILKNGAANFDYHQFEYTNFRTYMTPIKMLGFESKMSWWTQIIG